MRNRFLVAGVGLVLAVLALPALAPQARAEPGNTERGKAIYAKRCVLCHGEEGDGAGPAAERLTPPPRDFSEAQYKFKTTAFDDIVPNDADLFRMIRDGMANTAMPGWGDILSDQDIRDVIAYIKTFAGLEEERPTKQVDYGSQVPSSPESIAKGRALFHEDDRCSQCHGAEGKGDAIKKLKDDGGSRTWPRNLTKPWIFRASNDPKDIFTRISVGIPGTQMPSFANPKSKKRLSIGQRWHVANYVASLAKSEKVPRADNTVVKVVKVKGALPDAPDDPRWEKIPPTTFLLLPQLIAKTRLFMSSNDTVTVRAAYNESGIAIQLEWDDRTKSIPGDPKAEEIADPGMGEDMIAVQLPVEIPRAMKKPYFGMGDAALAVNLWQWRSGTKDKPASVGLANAHGFAKIERRDAASAGLTAKGRYDKGTWRAVFTRPLIPKDAGKGLRFEIGRFIPIAFAAWDGSNGEKGSKHTMTTWYWLLIEPDTGTKPLISALLVALLFGMAELWWARSAAARGREEDAG